MNTENEYKDMSVKEFKDALEKLEVREEKKPLIEVIKRIKTLEDKLYRKMNNPKLTWIKVYRVVMQLDGINKVRLLIQEELTDDEIFESLKF